MSIQIPSITMFSVSPVSSTSVIISGYTSTLSASDSANALYMDKTGSWNLLAPNESIDF